MTRTAYEIIDAKKNNQYLSYEDIEFFVNGYIKGNVNSSQMSAFLMAVCLNGMTLEETVALTDVMAFSGSKIDTSSIPLLLDKHSTGGVGDKTSFLVGSMLNALGYKVGMMSGRGLGHTGGTLDKLESIRGFRSDITADKYIKILSDTGFAIISQTDDIAPADKLMYSLRNETATIDSIPLIAASIMSKKIASGTQNIVLDVKYGDGAFIKELDKAKELAEIMVGIADKHNITATYVINSMDDVLGKFVGNSLEIAECIDIMEGNIEYASESLVDTSVNLAAQLVVAVNKDLTIDIAKEKLKNTLFDGTAKTRFAKMLIQQGGAVDEESIKLPNSDIVMPVVSEKSGVVEKVKVENIGIISAELGANRFSNDDEIYHDVGIEVCHHIGDNVSAGEPLAFIRYGSISEHRILQRPDIVDEARKRLVDCWTID